MKGSYNSCITALAVTAFPAEWKELRRGWYVGGAGFLEELEGFLDGAVAGRRRESHRGPGKAAHDEAAAEKELRRALGALG